VKGSTSEIVRLAATKDDPSKRRPDITVAKRELNWSPEVSVSTGLSYTIEYFRSELDRHGEFDPILNSAKEGGV